MFGGFFVNLGFVFVCGWFGWLVLLGLWVFLVGWLLVGWFFNTEIQK